MSINFRKIKDKSHKCTSCGQIFEKTLMMFECKIGEHRGIDLCDECMKELFNKSLKATCMVDALPKDARMQKIINERNYAKDKSDKIKLNDTLKDVKGDN